MNNLGRRHAAVQPVLKKMARNVRVLLVVIGIVTSKHYSWLASNHQWCSKGADEGVG
jgi:hypothetical protein